MEKFAPLLILLVAAEVALCATQCGHGNDEQLELFEKVHRNMNLTLDCDAVKNAMWFTQMVLDSQEENVNTQYWCKYLTKTYATWNFGEKETWIQDKLLKETNFDQVAQTALLHPNTKYGCAARRQFRDAAWSGYEDYVLLCIYEKLAPQDLCNIEWSY
ncbi:hypothetical protein Q1695_003595 [Nippostrongylus brasiliensis]|nr:hypothetical protein Q1695_003595 [Nippostrongylus brasiliensis]